MARPSAAVYNAFDPEVYRPRSEPRRHPSRLLYTGRITPEKGVHVLVDAFRELAIERPELELHLAGPVWVSDASLVRGTEPRFRAELERLGAGDYRAELLRRAGAAADRLRFLGSLDRAALAAAYNEATVFVHPALWEEPFGMTVVEAMACGTPVVVSRKGGMPEFVDDGSTGQLVEAGNVAELRTVLARLLDAPEARARLGDAAASAAVKRWTWECTAESLAPWLER